MDFSSLVSEFKIPLADSLFIISLQKSLLDCHLVKAKYVDAKKIMGIHAAVYKAAVSHHVYHSPNRSKSTYLV